MISSPTDDDLTRLARQALRVHELASAHLDGRVLVNDESDLDVIQELLDAGAVGKEDGADLECLGCIFGMLIVHAVADVDWTIVEDENGRDPALQYAHTSLLLFPLSMIAKRVEDGKRVDVRALFQQSCERLEELKERVPRPH